MEDDSSISRDGHGGWAIAVFHTMEVMQLIGVSSGAFWLATPFDVSFSAFIEESIHDRQGVVFLLSPVLSHIFFDLTRHFVNGSVGFIKVFPGFVFVFMGVWSGSNIAVIFFGAMTIKALFKFVPWSNSAVWIIRFLA